jgi:hypothetical protein
MASVTFSVSVGGDGSTVTDDANASTGLANGGHRTRFVPALGQIVAVASQMVTTASTVASQSSQVAADTSTVSSLYDLFDDRWLGAKAANPTLDNDGNALAVGAAYWNTASNQIRIWSGSSWIVQTFVPTAASSITVAADAGVTSTDVQAAIEELSAGVNLYEYVTCGGF